MKRYTVTPEGAPPPAPPAPEVPRLAEDLFRRESGRLVSVLTGIFGVEHLQLAEDVVQEALARALRTWPYHGIPNNPAAWLMQTARNLALDVVRRNKLAIDKQPQIIAAKDVWSGGSEEEEPPHFDDEIKDRVLRLIFVCCHPQIPAESQTALALKTLCGFGVTEIASAFLTSEAAVAKRLTRARQLVKDLQIPFEIPSGAELAPRLEGVLQILYLLFNEGYKASSGPYLVRQELCSEAIRLGGLLAEHPASDLPRVHALMALMLFNAARLSSRVDDDGNILRLKEQDRSTWDKMFIARGLMHLVKAARGEEVSEYHLQAGIAACHATAPDFQKTDWVTILSHYDLWMQVSESPVVALNRAVALSHVSGPAAGLEAVQDIHRKDQLTSYYLMDAVIGDLHWQMGNGTDAAIHFQRALDLAKLPSEREFFKKRLQECA
jgi:RNA polymerase sigma-70 factor (ECF subfamily)